MPGLHSLPGHDVSLPPTENEENRRMAHQKKKKMQYGHGDSNMTFAVTDLSILPVTASFLTWMTWTLLGVSPRCDARSPPTGVHLLSN